MNISAVRAELNHHVGDRAVIKHNLGRNKIEKYDVTIKELYDNVFLVEMNTGENKEVKSFSYSDIITKTIKIDY